MKMFPLPYPRRFSLIEHARMIIIICNVYTVEKLYDTSLRWNCALLHVLGYTEKYDDKRGMNPFIIIWCIRVAALYPRIMFYWIDDGWRWMNVDETLFSLSVRDLVFWIPLRVNFCGSSRPYSNTAHTARHGFIPVNIEALVSATFR